MGDAMHPQQPPVEPGRAGGSGTGPFAAGGSQPPTGTPGTGMPGYDPAADPGRVDPNRVGQPTAAQPAEPDRIKRTLSSALWTGLIIGAILLILLIVFIVENSRTVTIDLIFGDAHTALAIGLLLSAVIGALLVAIPGTIRMMQLRKEIKRRMR
jgi:putative membrane protein